MPPTTRVTSQAPQSAVASTAESGPFLSNAPKAGTSDKAQETKSTKKYSPKYNSASLAWVTRNLKSKTESYIKSPSFQSRLELNNTVFNAETYFKNFKNTGQLKESASKAPPQELLSAYEDTSAKARNVIYGAWSRSAATDNAAQYPSGITTLIKAQALQADLAARLIPSSTQAPTLPQDENLLVRIGNGLSGVFQGFKPTEFTQAKTSFEQARVARNKALGELQSNLEGLRNPQFLSLSPQEQNRITSTSRNHLITLQNSNATLVKAQEQYAKARTQTLSGIAGATFTIGDNVGSGVSAAIGGATWGAKLGANFAKPLPAKYRLFALGTGAAIGAIAGATLYELGSGALSPFVKKGLEGAFGAPINENVMPTFGSRMSRIATAGAFSLFGPLAAMPAQALTKSIANPFLRGLGNYSAQVAAQTGLGVGIDYGSSRLEGRTFDLGQSALSNVVMAGAFQGLSSLRNIGRRGGGPGGGNAPNANGSHPPAPSPSGEQPPQIDSSRSVTSGSAQNAHTNGHSRNGHVPVETGAAPSSATAATQSSQAGGRTQVKEWVEQYTNTKLTPRKWVTADIKQSLDTKIGNIADEVLKADPSIPRERHEELAKIITEEGQRRSYKARNMERAEQRLEQYQQELLKEPSSRNLLSLRAEVARSKGIIAAVDQFVLKGSKLNGRHGEAVYTVDHLDKPHFVKIVRQQLENEGALTVSAAKKKLEEWGGDIKKLNSLAQIAGIKPPAPTVASVADNLIGSYSQTYRNQFNNLSDNELSVLVPYLEEKARKAVRNAKTIQAAQERIDDIFNRASTQHADFPAVQREAIAAANHLNGERLANGSQGRILYSGFDAFAPIRFMAKVGEKEEAVFRASKQRAFDRVYDFGQSHAPGFVRNGFSFVNLKIEQTLHLSNTLWNRVARWAHEDVLFNKALNAKNSDGHYKHKILAHTRDGISHFLNLTGDVATKVYKGWTSDVMKGTRVSITHGAALFALTQMPYMRFYNGAAGEDQSLNDLVDMVYAPKGARMVGIKMLPRDGAFRPVYIGTSFKMFGDTKKPITNPGFWLDLRPGPARFQDTGGLFVLQPTWFARPAQINSFAIVGLSPKEEDTVFQNLSWRRVDQFGLTSNPYLIGTAPLQNGQVGSMFDVGTSGSINLTRPSSVNLLGLSYGKYWIGNRATYAGPWDKFSPNAEGLQKYIDLSYPAIVLNSAVLNKKREQALKKWESEQSGIVKPIYDRGPGEFLRQTTNFNPFERLQLLLTGAPKPNPT